MKRLLTILPFLTLLILFLEVPAGAQARFLRDIPNCA